MTYAAETYLIYGADSTSDASAPVCLVRTDTVPQGYYVADRFASSFAEARIGDGYRTVEAANSARLGCNIADDCVVVRVVPATYSEQG
jgi:hypothetical protein